MKNINYSCRAYIPSWLMMSVFDNVFWIYIEFPCPGFIIPSCTFNNERNVRQSNQLLRVLTWSRHVALIWCFLSTFPFSTRTRRLAGSSSQRTQGLPLFRKAQYATATASWATCPPQSRQYRPSLSITSGERQYVHREQQRTRRTLWEERPGPPVFGRRYARDGPIQFSYGPQESPRI